MASHLVIQSADRQTGTASEFRVQIPTFSTSGAVALLSASIPNTLYNVYTTNDYISWSRASTDYYVQVPHGGYGVTDLLPVIEASMNGIDAGGSYTATYSTITMKLT